MLAERFNKNKNFKNVNRNVMKGGAKVFRGNSSFVQNLTPSSSKVSKLQSSASKRNLLSNTLNFNEINRNFQTKAFDYTSAFMLGYTTPVANTLRLKRMLPKTNRNFLSWKLMELLRNRRR